MEQGNIHLLFVHMLRDMFRAQGAKISQQQLFKFLNFVEEICPWFPEEGTIDLETWIKVGQNLHDHCDTNGPEKKPCGHFQLVGFS
jgi:hypothetical protein